MADGPWANYQPEPEAGPWAKYAAPPPRPDFAKNPPAAAGPHVNMHPSYLTGSAEEDAAPKSATEVLGGMAKQTAQDVYDVAAPNILHQLYKKYTGQANTLAEIPEKAAMLAGPAMLGEIGGIEPGEIPRAPGVSRAIPAITPQASAPTGVGGQMADLASEALPKPLRMAYKVGKILSRNKPEAPRPTPVEPIPETNGVPWGTGGQGPIEMRGKMIPPQPPPVYPGAQLPAKPPVELLQSRALTTGTRAIPEPQSAALGRLPVPPQPPPENPEMPWGGVVDKAPAEVIPEQPAIVPGNKADIAETKAIQEQTREMGEREDRARLSAVKAQEMQGSGPQATKGELTGKARAKTNPLEGLRMDFSQKAIPEVVPLPKEISTAENAARQLQAMKDAGASDRAIRDFTRRAAGKFGPNFAEQGVIEKPAVAIPTKSARPVATAQEIKAIPPGIVPASGEDMTPILQKSVEQAKAGKAIPATHPIVQRALSEPITAIGQLSAEETAALNNAVKSGVLTKGKGGGFPMGKTVYARPGFDFAADRKAQIDELLKSDRGTTASKTSAGTPTESKPAETPKPAAPAEGATVKAKDLKVGMKVQGESGQTHTVAAVYPPEASKGGYTVVLKDARGNEQTIVRQPKSEFTQSAPAEVKTEAAAPKREPTYQEWVAGGRKGLGPAGITKERDLLDEWFDKLKAGIPGGRGHIIDKMPKAIVTAMYEMAPEDRPISLLPGEIQRLQDRLPEGARQPIPALEQRATAEGAQRVQPHENIDPKTKNFEGEYLKGSLQPVKDSWDETLRDAPQVDFSKPKTAGGRMVVHARLVDGSGVVRIQERGHPNYDYGIYEFTPGKPEQMLASSPDLQSAKKSAEGILRTGNYANAKGGAKIPADFPAKKLLVKVPDDGTFVIPNNPAAINRAMTKADKFQLEKEPTSYVRRIPKSPAEFDPERYIVSLEKEVADLEDKLSKSTIGNYGQPRGMNAAAAQDYLRQQLQAARENLAEAKASSASPK